VTAWARKHRRAFSVLFVAAFIVLIGVVYQAHQPPKIGLNGHIFKAEIANTEALREKGLSGRDSIGPKDSMVFVFNKQDNYCFWMKDMKFSIEMIWVDSSSNVTAIEYATPDSYPTNFCHLGKSVIEVAPGTAARTSLSEGDHVDL
jgi:uncharacterized membrane protein (UPF0127 family)